MSVFRKYAYAWITLTFFLVALVLHWWFGWQAYVDEAREHGSTPEVNAYLVEMSRDTFENWQSEFLQLLWQVVGLAYFLYLGSPSSKEWPAAGLVDTEIGCFHLSEVRNATKEVQPRVQA